MPGGTPADLCWQDTDGVSVDLRCFDRERAAAFAASAGGNLRAALDHADAALEQYRGELLPGVYDDWLLDARAALQRECVDLCALLSEGGWRWASRPQLSPPPAAGSGWRPWRRPGTGC
jgi:DNA-binding SARP family transcriptional activator